RRGEGGKKRPGAHRRRRAIAPASARIDRPSHRAGSGRPPTRHPFSGSVPVSPSASFEASPSPLEPAGAPSVAPPVDEPPSSPLVPGGGKPVVGSPSHAPSCATSTPAHVVA